MVFNGISDTFHMENIIHQYHKLTVLAPYLPDSFVPLEIMDDSYAVRACFVERFSIERLSSEWLEACGFYVLFSQIGDNGSFDAYVGKAGNGFANRLKSHNETKDFWRVALLVRRDTTNGFTTTESFYLEGRMREVLDTFPNVKIHNIAPTGDKTLPEHDKQAMESIILSVLRIMFLRGYRNSSARFNTARTSSNNDQGSSPAPPAPTMRPIANGYPVPVIAPLRKGASRRRPRGTGGILETPEGTYRATITFTLANGEKEHHSRRLSTVQAAENYLNDLILRHRAGLPTMPEDITKNN